MKRTLILALSALLFTGCDSCDGGKISTTGTAPTPSGVPSGSTNPPTHTPPKRPPALRFVAKKKGGDCPAAPAATDRGGFDVEPLLKRKDAPDALAAYCVYTWKPGKEKAPSLADRQMLPVDKLVAAGKGKVAFIEDPVINVPMAMYLQMVEKTSRETVRAQVGWASSWPQTPKPPVRVDIAIPDSSKDDYDKIVPSAFVHGYNVANLAVGLSSPKTSIPITTLALPRFTETQEAPNSEGYVGTQSDLAGAIDRAVEAWRTHGESHLVVNLSVGWECTDDPIELQPAFAAIQHAACVGAIVIAAAGNTPDDVTVKGPTCPAKWETIAAPDASACKTIEGKALDAFAGKQKQIHEETATNPTQKPSPLPGQAYTPLVYAVSGVDFRDMAIFNTRIGGRPRLAALGYEAVEFEEDDPPLASRLYTGTSVSAAVGSAAAAVVWSNRPDLAPAEVMQLVYESGLDLKARAEFCAGGSCGSIHRISVCSALAAACKAGPCRADVSALKCDAPPPPRPSNVIVTDAAYAQLVHDADAGAPLQQLTPTQPDLTVSLAKDEASYMTSLVVPQPISIPCPTCTWITISFELDGQIDPHYSGSFGPPFILKNLKLFAGSGATVADWSTFTPPTEFALGAHITKNPGTPTGTPASGTLTWTNITTNTLSQAVLIR